nr:two-component regulator propeller domain-containing protein [uncultured Pedobacter sp.]
MLKKLFFIFVFSFLGSTSLFAQKIFFRNYTVMDGLCANTIWDIEQDDQGFMWFGAKYGLNRFDGHEFKSYQVDKKNKNSIGNNFIRKIFKYDAQTFWIGTEEGLYIFDLTKETFTLFKPLGKNFINDIFRDSKKNIWIGTKINGVYKYQSSKKQLTNFVHSQNRPGLSSNEISKIIESNNGEIWIGTYGHGIDVLRYLRDLNQFILPNGLYKEQGPTFETPLSAAQNIQDMLLQSWGNKVRVFPAIPSTWKNIEFKNWLAEGAFEVKIIFGKISKNRRWHVKKVYTKVAQKLNTN